MASPNLPSSIWQFSSELYERIQSTTPTDNNIILSPFSIHLCLALTLMGAGGQTAKQIAAGLRLDNIENAVIAKEYKKLISSIKLKLSQANKIFIMKGYQIKKQFNETATKQFLTEIEEVNFGDATEAATIINKWVERKTSRRIKELVSPHMIDPLTRLILVNTVYFKCAWLYPFHGVDTKKQPFFHSETESHEVNMMQQLNYFFYSEIKELDAKVIVLKYIDRSLSMVIVLPNSRTGLDELNIKLKTFSLSEIIQKTRSEKNVNLCLPRFKSELETRLPDVLKNMGITHLFIQGKADLRRTLENANDIFVAEVIHKAFIEVTEKGTEAGAGTALQDDEYGDNDPDAEFTADHPFRYFIRNAANVVLFDGCYRNAGRN